MNLLEADSKLRKLNQASLTTHDVAAYLGISIVYASAIMRRLSIAERVIRLSRGRWLISNSVDPFIIPEYLTAPWPCYISLQTALHHHGLISQIPSIVYAVSLARTQRFANDAGEFSIHHLDPRFFFGFEVIGKSQAKMAVAEKALIDFLYLFPTRSRLFRALPELELPKSFSQKTAYEMITKIPSRAKQSLVRKRFEDLLSLKVS